MNMTIEEVMKLPLGNLECSLNTLLWGMDFQNPEHIKEAFEVLKEQDNVQLITSMRMLYDLATCAGWIPNKDLFYQEVK
jgi:hypothetical protein